MKANTQATPHILDFSRVHADKPEIVWLNDLFSQPIPRSHRPKARKEVGAKSDDADQNDARAMRDDAERQFAREKRRFGPSTPRVTDSTQPTSEEVLPAKNKATVKRDPQAPLEKRELRLTPASDTDPLPVLWGWKDRLPMSSLAMVAGREGTGKSTFCAWLAAQITRGQLPGEMHGKPSNVIYVVVEDSWRMTVVPRLMAAGADRSRVYRADIETLDTDDATLSLPTDNALLEEQIKENSVGLVIIDPIMSTMDDSLNENSTKQVRRVLDALAKMADRTGCMVVGIAHFNKGSGRESVMRVSASKAFTDVPRAVFTFADDSDTGTRVMSQSKNSLGPSRESMTYELEQTTVPTRLGPAPVSKFVFTGESATSVDDILAQTPMGHTQKGQTRALLLSLFQERGEDTGDGSLRLPAALVNETAREEWAISTATLTRASSELPIDKFKDGMSGGWVWILRGGGRRG